MDLYKKFYLDEETQEKMLNSAIVVFDTSALLDLYYYSSETQESIIESIFSFFKHRLWVPERVKFEYLKNKEKVSSKPILSYKSLIKAQNGGDGEYTLKMCNFAKEIERIQLKNIENQLKTLKERTAKSDKHGLNIIYLVNFINQDVHYTKVLNPLRNIHQIKSYYGVKYRYVQLFVALSKMSMDVSQKFFERERIKKLFDSDEIEVQAGYLEDEEFISVLHNCTVN